jgi:hypothetical protein
MFRWKSFPQLERQLRSDHYTPHYDASDEEAVISELCPTCGVNLKYIGYKNVHTYKAFMYCDCCRFWEQYV